MGDALHSLDGNGIGLCTTFGMLHWSETIAGSIAGKIEGWEGLGITDGLECESVRCLKVLPRPKVSV